MVKSLETLDSVVKPLVTLAIVKEPDPKDSRRRVCHGASVRWLPLAKKYRVVVKRSFDGDRLLINLTPTLRLSERGRLLGHVENLDEKAGSFDVVLSVGRRRVRRGFFLLAQSF